MDNERVSGLYACPDDETVAQFVDNRLAGEERSRMLEHLQVCQKCRDLYAEVLAAATEDTGEDL